MQRLLVDNPLVLLFACLAIGSAFGALRARGLMLGPAAVLFTALALGLRRRPAGAAGDQDPLGLALFAYWIGISAGPSLFGALRHHIGAVGAVVGALPGCAVLTHYLGDALHLGSA